MRIPTITGIIRRRLLVNFRVDPEVIERLLPSPLQPKLHQGFAIAGLCLIRLEQVRPKGLPALFGLASENAAHRIAVTWTDSRGEMREGVYIPRRDTGSRLNWLAGGRLFPGQHHLGAFTVRDDGGNVQLGYRAGDGLEIQISGSQSKSWHEDSCFSSVEESSRFFETGSVGYSVTNNCCQLDGLELVTTNWHVDPFNGESVRSSWFDDHSIFPQGTAEFDHALIMRNICHEWRARGSMQVEAPIQRECALP
ncbi:hypothetical protein AYO47_01705 [Planctomyces sp. SCGC AG-212-M04]|nr:hypothetical protein AYO47_01705 [Planctomyces sp. SCGC AG-212-M04]